MWASRNGAAGTRKTPKPAQLQRSVERFRPDGRQAQTQLQQRSGRQAWRSGGCHPQASPASPFHLRQTCFERPFYLKRRKGVGLRANPLPCLLLATFRGSAVIAEAIKVAAFAMLQIPLG